MNAIDTRKLDWEPIIDWSYIPKTDIGSFKHKFISQNDIIAFTTDKTKETARKLCIDISEYSAFRNIVNSENEAFYSALDNIFENYDGLGSESSEFLTIKKLFKLPRVPSNPVDNLLLQFEKLDDMQKAAVLEKLGQYSIKVVSTKDTDNIIKVM